MASSHMSMATEQPQSSRKRRIWTVRSSFTILLVLTLFAGVRALTLKEINIHLGNGQHIEVTTAALRVSSALAQAGVQLFDGDVVTPGLTTVVRHGDVISVRRAFPVKIAVDGKMLEAKTVGTTVGELLLANNVQLGKDDKVIPSITSKLTKETTVQVVRVSYGYTTVTESIPFKTVRRSDPTMDQGKTRVGRQGVNGTREITYKLTYENGELKSRKESKREVVKEPVDALIYVGSRVVPKTIHVGSGQYEKYTSVKTMLATAYTPGSHGITATGVKAKKGIVAVDPKVIPLGTRLYIPGYGVAIAADTGGAIKGNRIDLCLPTYREAINFGRRTVKVYVLASK